MTALQTEVVWRLLLVGGGWSEVGEPRAEQRHARGPERVLVAAHVALQHHAAQAVARVEHVRRVQPRLSRGRAAPRQLLGDLERRGAAWSKFGQTWSLVRLLLLVSLELET